MARWVLGMVLAGYGDACQRAGDLPAAVEAWQQALRVLDDLGLPDNLRVRPRLEQARSLSPPGSIAAQPSVLVAGRGPTAAV